MKLLSAQACSGAILIITSVALTQSANVLNRFAGTWKENQAKRQGPGPIDLRFRKTPSGGLEELRGPEVRPLVQPIRIGEKPYQIDGGSTNKIAWKQINANKFERALFGEGDRLLYTRRIQISADGKTLTEEVERKLADGTSSVSTGSYERTSTEAQGLAGTWKNKSFRTDKPATMKYEVVGNGALKVSDDRMGASSSYTMTFDGKQAPITGAAVIPHMTVAAKQINDGTIETTSSREGTVIGKSTMALSADGKTLTITASTIGGTRREPSIRVFEKQ
jgi:hypothetical protein